MAPALARVRASAGHATGRRARDASHQGQRHRGVGARKPVRRCLSRGGPWHGCGHRLRRRAWWSPHRPASRPRDAGRALRHVPVRQPRGAPHVDGRAAAAAAHGTAPPPALGWPHARRLGSARAARMPRRCLRGGGGARHGRPIRDEDVLVVAMSDYLAARATSIAPAAGAPHAGEPAVQMTDVVAGGCVHVAGGSAPGSSPIRRDRAGPARRRRPRAVQPNSRAGGPHRRLHRVSRTASIRHIPRWSIET